jgi:hypothetical protein
MLARVRSCFLLSFLLVFSLTACLAVHAQVNGVSPSATSIGSGASNNLTRGVRPSVTPPGPTSYSNNWPVFGNCCANFFLPARPSPPLRPERHHREDHAAFLVGIIEPVYIPYAVPYAREADDDSPAADSPDIDSPDVEDVQAPGAPNHDTATEPAGDRKSASKADASAKPTREPEDPVAAQPSTVLVFKDGHRSEVLNYAIVGDTLFDFDLADGRTRKILVSDLDLPATRKANDERGVDFQIPASTARQ